MAVWVGNNEIELGLQLINQAAPPSAEPLVIAQYEKLFLDVLLKAVFGNTRSLSYSPSSITNGYISLNFSSPTPIAERYFNVTPGTISGNTDYYNYEATQAFNTSAYPIGRFATEFGFHSMPSLQTWQQVAPPSDLYFNSSTILLHNHHYVTDTSTLLTADYSNQTKASLGGQGQMTIAGETYYPVPPKNDSSIANFTSWIYTTQVFQAEFARSQISFYRIGSALPQRTLGALYWMLNDIWQAPSWAGLEYDGRWKILHYIIKDVYKPVIVTSSFNYTTGDLQVWAVSDLWSPVEGNVNVTWFDWSGKLLSSNTTCVDVGAINATKVFDLNTNNLGFDLLNAVAKFEVEMRSSAEDSGEAKTYTHETWFHAVPLVDQKVVNPKLSLNYDNTTEKFVVMAESGVAAWIWLDHPAGVVGNFDDNGFWLLPGQKKEVRFKVHSGKTKGNWVEDVTVRSMWDNTQ
jgi:beta-mannosidase